MSETIVVLVRMFHGFTYTCFYRSKYNPLLLALLLAWKSFHHVPTLLFWWSEVIIHLQVTTQSNVSSLNYTISLGMYFTDHLVVSLSHIITNLACITRCLNVTILWAFLDVAVRNVFKLVRSWNGTNAINPQQIGAGKPFTSTALPDTICHLCCVEMSLQPPPVMKFHDKNN